MSTTRPKTARELCAFIDTLLAELPPKEQRRFWLLITEDKRNWHLKRVLDLFSGYVKNLVEHCGDLAKTYIEDTNDLYRQLKKHRRPTRNAERDAEIMRLNGAGKTAGEIVNALRGKYTLTDKQVNAVISRERKKAAKMEAE